MVFKQIVKYLCKRMHYFKNCLRVGTINGKIVENVPATALLLRFRVLLCVKRLAISCAMPILRFYVILGHCLS